jgi:hypothetical protein
MGIDNSHNQAPRDRSAASPDADIYPGPVPNLYIPPRGRSPHAKREPFRTVEEEVADLAPVVYKDVGLTIPDNNYRHMSESRHCSGLTLRLLNKLQTPARREMHETGGRRQAWHFIIAHTPIDQPPSEDDVITDLNPWQENVTGWDFKARSSQSGYLHGPRGEVMEKLREAQAPEWHISLRGLATLTAAHTRCLTPYLDLGR